MSYFDIRVTEEAGNLPHDIFVCRRTNETRHLRVEFRCVGVESIRGIVAVVKDDLAAWLCKANGLAQESSRIGNVTDNSVGEHQIVLPIMGVAALAVRLV